MLTTSRMVMKQHASHGPWHAKQRGTVRHCHRASQEQNAQEQLLLGVIVVRAQAAHSRGMGFTANPQPSVNLFPSTLVGSLVRDSMVPFPSNPPCSPWLSRPPKSSPTFIKCRCVTRPDLSLFPVQAIFISASVSFHSQHFFLS